MAVQSVRFQYNCVRCGCHVKDEDRKRLPLRRIQVKFGQLPHPDDDGIVTITAKGDCCVCGGQLCKERKRAEHLSELIKDANSVRGPEFQSNALNRPRWQDALGYQVSSVAAGPATGNLLHRLNSIEKEKYEVRKEEFRREIMSRAEPSKLSLPPPQYPYLQASQIPTHTQVADVRDHSLLREVVVSANQDPDRLPDSTPVEDPQGGASNESLHLVALRSRDIFVKESK